MACRACSHLTILETTSKHTRKCSATTDNRFTPLSEPDLFRMNYDQNDYAHQSLRSWVNVILGKMTSIDRRRKNICINGQTVLPYDHLILCTGEQYYLIAPLQARIYNSYSRQEVKPHITRPLFGNRPAKKLTVLNYFSICFSRF